MDAPECSIVIVTYNSLSCIENCLRRVVDNERFEIIVVDNCSIDGTPEFIANRFPRVKLVVAAKNLGFATANNFGFKLCNSDTILLLNPDAFISGTSQISEMKNLLWRDECTAFVGPQLHNTDGSHQVGDAGYDDTIYSLIGHFLFLHKFSAKVPATYLTNLHLLDSDVVRVDWICGACLMTKRKVIEKIGGLSEEIFMYGEDVEWGKRARAAGFILLYMPKVRVLHLQGALQGNTTVNVSNRWYIERAKNYRKISIWQYALFRGITLLGLGLRFVASLRTLAWHSKRLEGRRLRAVARLMFTNAFFMKE
jgi:N-acetylglucosaminyl-diphospho-decaprenol L-rhamnosyltransferase